MEHPALMRLLISVLALLWIAGLGLPNARGQAGEPQPYFSLGSSKTFKSGERPSIHLYASNVKELEFRVYRVNDPVEFFKGLEDAHRFGGAPPRSPQEVTLIERYHQWKRSIRYRIVNAFRAQYTKE